MKIRTTVTVDIDVDNWVLTYGIEKEQVRADVITYIQQGVQEMLNHENLLAAGDH